MIIEFDYQPALEDFRNNQEMELRAILKLFENTGNKHSDLTGDGILNRTQNGTAWVLTDWKVEIKRYPKYGEKIVAKTWTEPANALFTSTRDFEIWCNGELTVIATTRWAILDLTTGRPAKISPELHAKYNPEDKKTFQESKLERIAIPEKFDIEKEIIQRRVDIDFNNHVHNLVYLDYAFETIPEELFNNREFKHLRISYKLQLQYGEPTTCKYALIDGKHNFNIYGKENSLKAQLELY